MRPDQERVKNLLTDTVTLLCKNGLQFTKELKVQGLLGITTDDNDVFVVHINEKFGDAGADTTAGEKIPETTDRNSSRGVTVDLTDTDHKATSRPGQGTRKRSRESTSGQSHSNSQSHSQDNAILLSAKVKTEKREDAGLSSCESRLGGASSMDDRSAMHQTYSSLSLSDIQSGFPEFDPVSGVPSDGGGPPAKRHIAERCKSDGDNSEDSLPGQASWDNSLSGMSGENQQASLEGVPQAGCSAWDPSELPPGPDDSDGIFQPDFWNVAPSHSRRRPINADDKPHLCEFPGCGKRYYSRQNLTHHQVYKHGRKRTPMRKSAVPPDPWNQEGM